MRADAVADAVANAVETYVKSVESDDVTFNASAVAQDLGISIEELFTACLDGLIAHALEDYWDE